jgi:hypothetical protein
LIEIKASRIKPDISSRRGEAQNDDQCCESSQRQKEIQQPTRLGLSVFQIYPIACIEATGFESEEARAFLSVEEQIRKEWHPSMGGLALFQGMPPREALQRPVGISDHLNASPVLFRGSGISNRLWASEG